MEMKSTAKWAGMLLGAATLVIAASSASAEIVCNGEGECWHVKRHYDYRPEFGLVVHPDGWAWGANEHYRWHEGRGRGYWHNGIWIRL
jgi:hypothetical protein